MLSPPSRALPTYGHAMARDGWRPQQRSSTAPLPRYAVSGVESIAHSWLARKPAAFFPPWPWPKNRPWLSRPSTEVQRQGRRLRPRDAGGFGVRTRPRRMCLFCSTRLSQRPSRLFLAVGYGAEVCTEGRGSVRKSNQDSDIWECLPSIHWVDAVADEMQWPGPGHPRRSSVGHRLTGPLFCAKLAGEE
jgi:hypothetical protein